MAAGGCGCGAPSFAVVQVKRLAGRQPGVAPVAHCRMGFRPRRSGSAGMQGVWMTEHPHVRSIQARSADADRSAAGHRQLGGARANPALAASRGCAPAVASLQDTAEICAIGPLAPAAKAPRCADRTQLPYEFPRAGRVRAGADQSAGQQLRLVLAHRARQGSLRPLARDPPPGPRLGGQSGGVLRTGRHRSRSGAARRAGGEESKLSKRLPAGRRPTAPARRSVRRSPRRGVRAPRRQRPGHAAWRAGR